MLLELALIALSSLLLSAMLTGLVRKQAISRGLLDVPNARSSHVLPTPRGGGLAIVLATIAGLAALVWMERVTADILIAIGGGGTAVAVVGYLDDRHRLRAGVRLAVHFGAALWALAWLGGLPPLQLGTQLVTWGWGGYALGAVGIVWTLNLFNFMDGIDGIAASEAVFILAAGALVACWSGAPGSVPATCVTIAAACAGFLARNWPPAQIFMGDVGSGFLGYVIAVMAIVAARYDPVTLLVWVILGGIFFADATITLIRRVARGERAHEAHRTHAYQWLSRKWGSHRKVTVAVLLVNMLVLLPAAVLAAATPVWAGVTMLVAFVPLAIVAVLAGAGREENPRAGRRN